MFVGRLYNDCLLHTAVTVAVNFRHDFLYPRIIIMVCPTYKHQCKMIFYCRFSKKKTIVKVQTMSTDQAPMPHKLIKIMAPGHICDAMRWLQCAREKWKEKRNRKYANTFIWIRKCVRKYTKWIIYWTQTWKKHLFKHCAAVLVCFLLATNPIYLLALLHIHSFQCSTQ